MLRQSVKRRFVDLSVTLENGVFAILRHWRRASNTATVNRALLQPTDLPAAEGWAAEWLHVTTHNGTHMDAPWHYASTMDGGKRAIGIDELPLKWCFAPGVKLDFRHMPDGHVVMADAVAAEFERIAYTLQPYDIVLVNTAAAAHYGTPRYLDSGCGMGRAATLWLLERGVRVVGTDA